MLPLAGNLFMLPVCLLWFVVFVVAPVVVVAVLIRLVRVLLRRRRLPADS